MLLDEMPELRVVVTSSHREGLGLSGVQGLLPTAVARRTIGVTPLTPRCRARGGRQDEIEAWLAEHTSVSRFAAIDDEPHLYAQGCPWLVVTHPWIGWDAEASQRLREQFARTP